MLASLYVLAYNHEHLISDAIDGALGQTYSPLEIIISDDYSTDRTWEIIQDRIRNYHGPHRLIVRRNTRNLGISQHINEVWKICSGEWVVASAGDDVSLPTRVEQIIKAAQTYSTAKLVQSWLNEVDINGSFLHLNNLGVRHFKIFPPEKRLHRLGYAAHGAAMAYSREVIDFFGPLPPGVMFEDNIVNVRAELLGGVLILPHPLVNHRNHDGQVTRINARLDRVAQRSRLERVLDSDINSIRQNARDVEAARTKLQGGIYRAFRRYYQLRSWYYSTKRNALLKPWPVRLFYLAMALPPSRRLGPFRRDEVARAVLPESLYYALKKQ